MSKAEEVKIPLTKGLEATIDVDLLPFVEEHNWHAIEGEGGHYAATSMRVEGPDGITLVTRVYLQRLVMKAKPNQIVRFKSGDTLDCRRRNLRLIRRASRE